MKKRHPNQEFEPQPKYQRYYDEPVFIEGTGRAKNDSLAEGSLQEDHAFGEPTAEEIVEPEHFGTEDQLAGGNIAETVGGEAGAASHLAPRRPESLASKRLTPAEQGLQRAGQRHPQVEGRRGGQSGPKLYAAQSGTDTPVQVDSRRLPSHSKNRARIQQQPGGQVSRGQKGRRAKVKPTGWQIASRILIAFLVLVLVLGGLVFALWRYTIGSANTGVKDGPKAVFKKNSEPSSLTEAAPPLVRDGQIINILLMGLDFADEDEVYSRSDTMMLATIDQKNNKIKLTSFQRDMLVYLPGSNQPVKLNQASEEGPQRLISVLNNTFDLDIRDYILFDINGAEDVIDSVGGIEIDVPQDQAVLDYLNRLIEEQNAALEGWDEEARTRWSPYVWRGGRQLLNGRQAIAYARMRELDTDFHRMKRQQDVVGLMLEKAKSNITTIPTMVRSALSHVTTNLTDWELTQLGLSILPKLNNGIDQMQIPLKGYFWMDSGDIWCIRANFNLMIPTLHQFVYGKPPAEFASVPLVPYTPLARTDQADMPAAVYSGAPADVPYTGAMGKPGGEVLRGEEILATAEPAPMVTTSPPTMAESAGTTQPEPVGGADLLPSEPVS